ncbi:MAG: YbjN domain-containing protein [Alphaproteobacteria bacterium]|nr:YbjN domain-containing protein [Alphaproteobacteria bacterium]MBF0128841.1 YbjN domain-containing protein [Alphaproteobacteria bacterium]
MRTSLAYAQSPRSNPLDRVEEIAGSHGWAFDRRGDEEMAVEVPGQWATYSLYVVWSEDVNSLHLSMALGVRVPDRRWSPVCELLALVNERLWLGHFALWSDEGMPMFRHSVLARGGAPLGMELLEELIEVARRESERFYPAFQFVIWGGKSAEDALTAAMLDTVGEA